MITFTEILISEAPYPGLRPFDTHEVDIFFGRDQQTDKLLERLQRTRFLAVVGSSGCGKSSLVRAGMIAGLETGFLSDAGSQWRIAEMRPGERPLARLAEALLSPTALGPELAEEPNASAFLQATLRRGPLGLVEIMREVPLNDGENLLILVDQFEEIFRFRQKVDADEADAFVALLLAATQHEVPIYVVITMRSDFLGDAALFTGLPEVLNDSQFLTPRLSREQCQAAIEKPARVFGGKVDPALANRLLNDMGADPDWLPLLQHVLMRMWTRVTNSLANDFAEDNDSVSHNGISQNGSTILTLDDYLAIGTLDSALSEHCDEVYDELSDEQKRIAEVMFRWLTERGAGQRDTRRPAQLGEIAAVAGVSVEEVATVANEFRRADRSFMTPRPPHPLTADTVLDISHETLIRQWKTLKKWVVEEARSAANYQRLKQTAELWKSGDAALWGSPDLERALEWQTRQKPTLEWATRYSDNQEAAHDFALAMEFLETSKRRWDAEQQRKEEELERRKEEEVARRSWEEKQKRLEAQARAATIFRRLSVVIGVALLIASIAASFALQQKQIASQQAKIARENEVEAKKQTKIANTQAKIAKVSEVKAKEQKSLAESNAKKAKVAEAEAKKQTGIATANASKAKTEAEEAQRQRSRAEEQRRIAVVARYKAEQQRQRATKQAQIALAQRKEAERQQALAIAAENKERLAKLEAEKQTQIAKEKQALAVAAENKERLAKLEAEKQREKAELISQYRLYLIESLDNARNEAAKYARSYDGRYVLTVLSDGKAVLLDAAGITAWKLVSNWQTNITKATYVAFSPKDYGNFAVTGGQDGTVELWNSTDGKIITLKEHTRNVNKVAFIKIAFGKEGKEMQLVATGSDDHSARIWEIKNGVGVRLQAYNFRVPVKDVSFQMRDEQLICIVSSGDGISAQFDALTGTILTPRGATEQYMKSPLYQTIVP